MAHTVTLTWNASTDVPADNYNVYRGTAAGQESTLLNSSPISALTYIDTPGPGTWFYVVKSVSPDGTELSVASNEASAVVPLQPPTNLMAVVA